MENYYKSAKTSKLAFAFFKLKSERTKPIFTSVHMCIVTIRIIYGTIKTILFQLRRK